MARNFAKDGVMIYAIASCWFKYDTAEAGANSNVILLVLFGSALLYRLNLNGNGRRHQ